MIKKSVWHPFFISLASVLSMYVANIHEIPPGAILRSIIVCQLFTMMVFAIVQILLRDWELAGLVSFTCLLIGLNYGSFFQLVYHRPKLKILFAFMLIFFFAILLYFILKREFWNNFRDKVKITKILNILLGMIIVFSIVQISLREMAIRKDNQVLLTFQQNLQKNTYHLSSNSPKDIYYIILDGYGREDVMRELFGFDNSAFIKYLTAKGFYIANESRSNYMQTALSLSSSLNMAYLNEFASSMDQKSRNRIPLAELIQQSYVRKLLEEQGYQTVVLYSGYYYSNITDANVYLTPFIDINEFESILLYNTILRSFLEENQYVPIFGYQSRRRTIQFSLGKLSETIHIPGPKFTFVHVVAPHPPFVFNRYGNPIEPDFPYSLKDGELFEGSSKEYVKGYVDQTLYLNRILEQEIDEIIEGSPHPPIIIIQGDHGPRSLWDFDDYQSTCLKELTSILNAYYFPDQKMNNLYSSISPVNSFRILFNEYFSTNFPLLPDQIYYSSWWKPYAFIDITSKEQENSICEIK